MSVKIPLLVGVRLLFLGPSCVFLKSVKINQSTFKSKVNANLFYNGNTLIGIQNQLMLGNYHGYANIHTSNKLLSHNQTKESQSEVFKDQPKEVKPKKKKKPLRKRIIHELKHYYHGFRLLYMNAKIALKLTVKRFGGRQLTRREHNLLKRTVGDIFRLLPFSIFILVPFMELTLPIFLKIFPGMLPTTFQTKKEKAAKAKKSFKVKLEMTKFLQETLDEMAPLVISGDSSQLAKEFSDFFQKVRTTGEIPSSHEIMKYSKLFEDEITLDKLPRAQIIALCRFLNIPAIGTTRFLRYQLKTKIRNIQIDDKIIQKEGIQTMKLSELKEACRVRGMRFYGISQERLRIQLQQWLDLSLVKKIPPSLLLLSQAFTLTKQLPNEKVLAATIQSLPTEVGTATKAALSEREGRLDYETEIRLLKDELHKISEESAETQQELQKKMEAFMIDPESETSQDQIRYELMKKKMYEDLSVNELAILEDALGLNLYIEKDCLAELKSDLENYEQKIKELKEIMSKVKQSEIILETLATKRLHKKLILIIKRLDEALLSLEKREAEKHEEPSLDHYKAKRPGTVKIEDLIDLLRDKRLGEPLPLKAESQIAFILNKLDTEKDGFVKIRKVSKLLDILSREDSIIDLQSIIEHVKTINNEERLENLNESEDNSRDLPF